MNVFISPIPFINTKIMSLSLGSKEASQVESPSILSSNPFTLLKFSSILGSTYKHPVPPIERDIYKDLDNDWRVLSDRDQWHDAYASKRYIEKRFRNEGGSQEELLEFFNTVIDSLQEVHSKKIKINMDAFENIDLTSTDMVVKHQGLPYPIVVPSFPIITTDDRLDYGSKLE